MAWNVRRAITTYPDGAECLEAGDGAEDDADDLNVADEEKEVPARHEHAKVHEPRPNTPVRSQQPRLLLVWHDY